MNDSRGCPDDELLIGYMHGDLSAPEQLRIDDHLGTCDRCVELARNAHARLRVLTEQLAAPPHAIEMRARDAVAPQPVALRPERSERGAHPTSTLQTILATLLRLPILIPVSVAAGALLVVAAETWRPATPQHVLIRAVRIERTARPAIVHAAPREGAPSVGTLNRGEMVEIRAEQATWYRIALPNGKDGWVERSTFE